MRIIGDNPAAENAEITAVASGTLPSGQPVIVNADGTVSVVEETGVSQAIGSPASFAIGTATAYTSSTYDSNSNKVIVVYQDEGDLAKGKAVVGTISGTSISFGSPVVFAASGAFFPSISYDGNSQKVVIAYRDYGNSNFGTALVGTVSGTSISFGSPTVFESSSVAQTFCVYDEASQKTVVIYEITGGASKAVVSTVSGTAISFGASTQFESGNTNHLSAAYHSAAAKVVITYSDSGNSDSGTAVVGTVSGTSISFGSLSVFSSDVNYTSVAYDVNAQKVVVAYRGTLAPKYGKAIVGTVSGTSISFGSAVTFESAETDYVSISYNGASKSNIIAYRDVLNSNQGTLIEGTVSGTSITFGTPVVFNTGSTIFTSITYEANSNVSVVSYRNLGGDDGVSIVFQPAYTVTNLTSENYIGMANGSAADTGKVKVNIGCAINGAQSGLTAGQTYYVQTDGTLGLAPADPSVIAGTAISATEIIVKG